MDGGVNNLGVEGTPGYTGTRDYDGDGKTDQAVYRDGVWWILRSSNGGGENNLGWSTPGYRRTRGL